MQHATLATVMLSDNFFGEPIPVTDERHDRDLAAWSIGRTVRKILDVECSDGSCIDDPATLRTEIVELIPDIQGDDCTQLRQMAHVVFRMCGVLIRERATGATA